MNQKMSIVILNYVNYKDTIECVESIMDQYNNNEISYEIIIVDNCSPNESFNKLKLKYSKINRIHILKNEKNEGFARGNNRGIRFSLENLNCNKILVLNNDTIMSDCKYLYILYKYNYKKDRIGAIGTKIIGCDNIDQNPVYVSIGFRRLIYDFAYSFLKYTGIYSLLRSFYKRIIKSGRSEQSQNKYNQINDKSYLNDNYILHGSAIYLTPLFFEYYNGLYSRTFLYYEENILAIMLKKANINWLYFDKIGIYHKEDRSSNIVFSNLIKTKNKYLLRSILQAFKIKMWSFNRIKRYTGQIK
jgi:GT2 family glycosyltransferase